MKTKSSGGLRQAPASGLVLVSDEEPGISRRRAGKGYSYRTPEGHRITDPAVRQRIDSLVIPPAWSNVWICPVESGHIQATGRDAKGRKQYIYHVEWRAARDATKFQQLEQFAYALPRIRRRVRRDMSHPRHGHVKMVATAVRMLELTLVRIGSQQYVRSNKSYGLTTLRRRHASVHGSTVHLRFKGKSGVLHDVTVKDRRVARVLRRCLDIPGQKLFHYRDADGTIRHIDSGDVNDYLKSAGDAEFTARHYRTWAASVFAMALLQRAAQEGSPSKVQLNRVIERTAQRLRNTPAICRKCYIHPAVMDAYLGGTLPPLRSYSKPSGLHADERRFLHFLQSLKGEGTTA